MSIEQKAIPTPRGVLAIQEADTAALQIWSLPQLAISRPGNYATMLSDDAYGSRRFVTDIRGSFRLRIFPST
jgi:hypothetical protein